MNTQTNNTTTGNQTAMGAAIQAANTQHVAALEAVAKATSKPSMKMEAMPAIVVRRDLLGAKIIFLASTYDREAGSIFFWDGKKGSKPSVAPIAYYQSTKPLETREDAVKLAEAFSKEFGVKNVELRQRLIKNNVLERDNEGKVEKGDIDNFKLKLVEAVTKAIMSA